MGLSDTIGRDDRAEIKVTELYDILREGALAELLINAVNCNIPHRYIREMVTGKSEAPGQLQGKDTNRVGVSIPHA